MVTCHQTAVVWHGVGERELNKRYKRLPNPLSSASRGLGNEAQLILVEPRSCEALS